MDTYSINLLRTQSILSSDELLLLSKLKLLSIILVVLTLVSGLFVGAAYLAGKLQFDQLENKRQNLSRTITTQARKQILLLSLQDRLPIVEKTIAAQYPWERVIDNITQIVSPQYLKTLAIGQNNSISVVVQTESLEEVTTMISDTLKQVQDKKMRNPQINTLTINKDGTIDTTFTFVPIL